MSSEWRRAAHASWVFAETGGTGANCPSEPQSWLTARRSLTRSTTACSYSDHCAGQFPSMTSQAVDGGNFSGASVTTVPSDSSLPPSNSTMDASVKVSFMSPCSVEPSPFSVPQATWKASSKHVKHLSEVIYLISARQNSHRLVAPHEPPRTPF